MKVAAPVFRFEAERHEYFLDDVPIPSITQLISRAGLVTGQEFMTEASRERGTEIHRLCSEWDFGTLDLLRLESPQRGAVLAYVAASAALKPTWEDIEVADVHPTYRFAGRIDRAGLVFKRETVGELKSGAKAGHHAIQLALQAILRSVRVGVPAEQIQRICIYVKHTGKFSIEQRNDPRDFLVAKDLIRRFCR